MAEGKAFAKLMKKNLNYFKIEIDKYHIIKIAKIPINLNMDIIMIFVYFIERSNYLIVIKHKTVHYAFIKSY